MIINHSMPGRADLLRRAGWMAEARLAYGRAYDLSRNEVERRYLLRPLGELESWRVTSGEWRVASGE
jgi:predicted RNA polymerase sigma factor